MLNLSFVLPGLYLNILKTEGNIAILGNFWHVSPAQEVKAELSFLKIVKIQPEKIFSLTKFSMILKIEISSLQRALTVRCTTFVFYHFVELWTLELVLEFLEFLLTYNMNFILFYLVTCQIIF